MAKTLVFFNNKGGVSKTTTCFNVGWMLAEQGKKVIMVDADPQCNLTGMVLDLSGEGALNKFYSENPNRNIKDALEPAFSSRPKALEPVECVSVDGCENLFLLPGHVAFSEYEVQLGIAQQLSESLQALKNLPGSFSHIFKITADRYAADYVLIDLSPSLGAINQNLVTTSDFTIIPISPDIFSVMALESLARVLPQWIRWGRSAYQLEALANADYAFPEPRLKVLGTIVQKYRLKSGVPTEAFRNYIQDLDNSISGILYPALEKNNLLLPESVYKVANLESPLRLASIPDFNTLIAYSQQCRKPVFKLTQSDVRRQGKVWDAQSQNIETFRGLFKGLADKIEKLTS